MHQFNQQFLKFYLASPLVQIAPLTGKASFLLEQYGNTHLSRSSRCLMFASLLHVSIRFTVYVSSQESG